MQSDSKESVDQRRISEKLRQVDIRDGKIDSQELFQSGRELHILHRSEIYRLRVTGLNKLILTK